VSNFDVSEMEQVLSIAGEGRCACNQVLYHLGERYAEARLIDWCARRDIAVVAYSPFGSGQFPSAASPGGPVLERIARAHGVTAHQVALAFLIRFPSVFAIPKASRARHARENAGAAELILESEEIHQLDQAFPCRQGESLPVL